MLEFTVITTIAAFDGEERPSYGIEIFRDEAIIGRHEGITFLKERIEFISGVCNKCQVSPIHFADVLENYMSDFNEF